MDQATEQSQPSIRERIAAVVSTKEPEVPQEAPVEAPEVETPEVEAPQVAETPPEVPETDPTADWKEVELEGEKLQVPPKWEKAFLQEKDYTQKTQALADQRRLIDQREANLQAQEQTFQQLQPLYLQAHAMEQSIQQYQKIDWQAFYASDPVECNNKKADYALLLQQRQELFRHIEQGQSHLTQQRNAAMAQAAQAAMPIIKKAIPDWSAEKDAQLTKFALDAGATAEELTGLVARPWAVILLEQARKFQELQANKAQLPRKAGLSPVAKPGAKQTVQSSEHALYRKNLEQFRKSGGKDSVSLKSAIAAKLKNLGS